jgi:dTDP-4-amino-4,6-dideoxygalactose transaminase
MIPQRRPPFSVGRVIKSIFDCSNSSTVEQIEKAYAQTYSIPHAILLPSCRAGICWALQAKMGAGTRVLCPAFTCFVVWEAIIRSGRQLQLIDNEEDGFLMDKTAMKQAQKEEYCIVLCEIYGYTYNLSEIAHHSEETPVFRIIDMAMTVPAREHFERLLDSDFAVISFGAGKCIYAGWGGMAFTRDEKLARDVKEIRDRTVLHSNMTLILRRSLRMIALNIMSEPFAYGFLKNVKDATRVVTRFLRPTRQVPLSFFSCERPLSEEWFLPSTYVDRNLMLHNLSRIEEYKTYRQALSERYHKNLCEVSGLIRPKLSPYALSHYTIRVKPSFRPFICSYLLKDGIEVSTLFDFPNSLSKSEFPHASRIASEVINLPLDVTLSLSDIDRISESVSEACLKYN